MLACMQSSAKSVEDYLASLPDDRRVIITKLRSVILKNLPRGYEEVLNWGMITYQVPISIEPDTYNKLPLMYAALASQKNNISLYYTFNGGKDLAKVWKNAKKKPDVGKSCLRFKSLDDVDVTGIGKLIASKPIKDFIRATKT
jgi:hypothetical protein